MSIKRLLGTDRRTILLRKNIFAGIVIKGWSGLAQLIVVPLTLRCLGEYNNGVWMAIYAILLWMDNLDIGLGNGMRNLLASHLAHQETEKAREAVSSTYTHSFMRPIAVGRQQSRPLRAVRCQPCRHQPTTSHRFGNHHLRMCHVDI